jgi:ribosomal protein S18 acetylase RimI-like enzyme
MSTPAGAAGACAAPVVRFVPFDEDDFAAWLAQAIPAYALEHIEDGQWAPAEAVLRSQQAHEALLPQGVATPGHTFMHLQVEGESPPAGFLWWAETEAAGVRGFYVYGLEVNEEARRRGIAGAALAELERRARVLGLAYVALHVFGHNLPARRLYEQSGFEPTNINMRKKLR